MIIARTPFRISFFGGGTDFPEFYLEHGGATLLTTINQYSYISIHTISQFFDFRFRASYAKTEPVQHPSQFKHPLIRECLLYLNITDGLEITHVGDLPGRSGLGTSSSFTVGLLHTLHALRGDRITAEDLAREAIIIERERAGDSGGRQDQYAAAYGGFIRLDFGAEHFVNVQKLPLSSTRLADLEQRLMLFYTNQTKSAEGVLTKQKGGIADNIGPLKEMHAMVDQAEHILLHGSDLDQLGHLLHRSWMLKKSLAKGISNSSIDHAYSRAQAAGAFGGKLLGAGGRGFLLLYVPPEKHTAVREALSELREVPFSFSQQGSQIIFKSSSQAETT